MYATVFIAASTTNLGFHGGAQGRSQGATFVLDDNRNLSCPFKKVKL